MKRNRLLSAVCPFRAKHLLVYKIRASERRRTQLFNEPNRIAAQRIYHQKIEPALRTLSCTLSISLPRSVRIVMEFRLLFVFLLLLLLHHTKSAEEATTLANSSEENDSSSEETVEDSNESTRRRRSAEAATLDSSILSSGGGGGDDSGKKPARALIPGLPDPATILKIAEILQAVGEKVIPVLVQGNQATDLDVVADRIGRDYQFLKNFKREIDAFAGALKTK